MKFSSVLMCFCLGAITTANSLETYQQTDPRILNPDTILLQIFETLRWMIKHGSVDVFPKLDPWKIEKRSLELNVPNKLLTINANFTNGVLTGLGDFQVIKAEFVKSEIAIDLAINFPLLTLAAEQYEMEGDLYTAIPLEGYGSFEFQIFNFNFSSKIYLKQSDDGESALIDKFYGTQYSIDKITSHSEFDKNIDDIFNALVEDLLAFNLSRFNQMILKKYSDGVLENINNFLDNYDTWRFIAAIL